MQWLSFISNQVTESLAEYIQLPDANAEIIGNIEKNKKIFSN